MKYLKYFKTDVDCQNYFNSDDFVTPNVSYAEDADVIYCKPIKSANSTIYATYSATDDNKLAIANTSNVKSLKVDGNSVSFGDTYDFKSNGEHKVEIELIDDSVINGVIIDNGNVLSLPMFSNGEVSSCLTNITIPDSVTSIGMFAFIGCSSLTSATIGNSVTSIGEGAFNSCFGLTSINIPDSVTSIGNSAFDSCFGLTSINIPDSVTSIGNNVFGNCSGLTSATIGNFVTSIGENAFSNCYSLTSINIPDSVTSIGNYAFYDCSSLTSINIPDSVTSIGQEAFDSCEGLVSITIGSGVTSIGDMAFRYCSSLTSITIPKSVISIGQYTFDGCSKLNEITCLATTAPSIVYQTFSGIKQNGLLKVPAGSDYSSWMSTGDYYLGKYNWHIFTGDDSIIMTSESNPEVMKVCYNQGWAASPYEMYASEAAMVTSIGRAFEDLGKGDSDGYGYNEYSSGYDSPSTSFTFSFDEFKYFTGVTSIGIYAFMGSNIVSINIPNSVTSIGNSAFENCLSLTSITIPDSVTSIGDSAFGHCSGLTSINIPDSVTSIGYGAFFDCNSLPAEDNLRYAGRYLIGAVDTSLSTYTIKKGTKWIGDAAFHSYSSLTSINIPDSVTSIGNAAFHSCSSLTSINIPDSVTSIGSTAFFGCSSLNEITCLATTAPSISSNTFRSIKENGKLRVPAGSDYRSWMSTRNYYLGYYNWTSQEIQS